MYGDVENLPTIIYDGVANVYAPRVSVVSMFVREGRMPTRCTDARELLVATGQSNVTIHDQRFCEVLAFVAMSTCCLTTWATLGDQGKLLGVEVGKISGGHFAALVLPQPTRNDVRALLRKTRVFLEGKMRMGRNVIENAIGAAALFPILRVPILVHWAGLVSDSDPWSMVNQTGLQNNFTNSLC